MVANYRVHPAGSGPTLGKINVDILLDSRASLVNFTTNSEFFLIKVFEMSGCGDGIRNIENHQSQAE